MKSGRQSHGGHRLRGSDSEWSRLRLAQDLSITELAHQSGIARSIVGLIDQGRVVPKPEEARALLNVLLAAEGDQESAPLSESAS